MVAPADGVTSDAFTDDFSGLLAVALVAASHFTTASTLAASFFGDFFSLGDALVDAELLSTELEGDIELVTAGVGAMAVTDAVSGLVVASTFVTVAVDNAVAACILFVQALVTGGGAGTKTSAFVPAGFPDLPATTAVLSTLPPFLALVSHDAGKSFGTAVSAVTIFF
jgi:hypothetical protein